MSYSSFGTMFRTTSWALQSHTQALTYLQQQASTGNRIIKPSDDVSDANRILTLRTEIRDVDHYMTEMDRVVNRFNSASANLELISERLTGLKGDLTRVMSMDASARQGVAAGMDDLINQMVSLANTKHQGQYYFGGDNSSIPPYKVEKKNGQIDRIVYQGSTAERRVELSPGVEIGANFVGDDIFRASGDRQIFFVESNTGAVAGTGTSSVKGDFELEVTHDGTNYQISIDGGLSKTTVPVGGEANTAVTDSRTGEVMYVDTTGITQTGTDQLSVRGTHDVFNLLIKIRNLLKDTDTEAADVQLDEAIKSLQEVHDKVAADLTLVGSRITSLQTVVDSFENVKVNSEEEATTLQQADIAQVAMDLTRRQTLYQMSLSVTGKLMSTSLVDFIN
ncbi:flagellar hook-associated protein FlgL [Anaerohalosphaera lusitana]|uniref:Flagellar hook-associated protein FlgL n=1 Tax=Anaerohalosphaera lusitana TaxID=1936003 RepID=A0A1U9NGQ1_9BACT|nr:flagellar hook-associated protein FlgL [Anaerohalosphaera lusitana]AQT66914.1 flagellar hook-associated protein FlgL [Anaerohalosphaera lusitana]